MSPDKLKPFQALMDELSNPENRPSAPPIDPTFKQELRQHLLNPPRVHLSGRAIGRLWQFGLTAVLLLILFIGLINWWLTLANQPSTAAPVGLATATPLPSATAIPPTATPSPFATPEPIGLPLVWKTDVSYPALIGDGLQVREVVIASDTILRGQTIHFSLIWSTNKQPAADYTSFIHLRDHDGVVLAQHDLDLGPTSVWEPNSYATYDYSIPIPHGNIEQLPYQLVVGLYNTETNERLMAAGDDGTVLLAKIDTALVEAHIEGTTGNGVALRPQPDGEAVAVLAEGEIVRVSNGDTVEADGLAWQQVETGDGQLGWVPADFISEGRETAVSSPEATTCLSNIDASSRFVPATPFPKGVAESLFWLGSEALWTAVPPDYVWRDLPQENGRYSQKLFWWSEQYDIDTELNPDIVVTGRRLDANAAPLETGRPTNGFSDELGTFMLTGVTLPTAGCWEINGVYKGNALSFIVWIES